MRVVLDTNILVSALLTPGGNADRIVRAATTGALLPLHDERVLAEYREVIHRPKFAFDPRIVRAVLAELERGGLPVVASPVSVVLPDPDDLPFLEVAASGRADALITGNERHFSPESGDHAVPIRSPAVFLERWG